MSGFNRAERRYMQKTGQVKAGRALPNADPNRGHECSRFTGTPFGLACADCGRLES